MGSVVVLVAALAVGVGAGCSGGSHAGEPVHPMLQCGGSGSTRLEADFDVSLPGFATTDEAKEGLLDYYVERFGGTVVDVDDRTVALLVDGAVVVVAPIDDAPAGGFWTDTFYMCSDFVPQEDGPPETEPLAAPASDS